MSTPGRKTIMQGIQTLQELCLANETRIQDAWINCEENLTINLHMKIKPDKAGVFKVDCGISFVVERAKDDRTTFAAEEKLPIELYAENKKV